MPRPGNALLVCLAAASPLLVHAEPPNQEQLDALKPFHAMVGHWKGQGMSPDSVGWTESDEVSWGYRDTDGRVSLNVYATDSELIDQALLTYDPSRQKYGAVIRSPGGKLSSFVGDKTSDAFLTLDRISSARDKIDRLEIKLLRLGDKLMFTFLTRKGRTLYEQYAQIELFREGPSMVDLTKAPRCPVTGGVGYLAIEHDGETVYVSDPATEKVFLADPERYLPEEADDG